MGASVVPRVCRRGVAMLCLVHLAGSVWAQELPDTVSGLAQVYDGVTFDVVQGGSRYRAVTRIRVEAVEACEVRQKAKLDGIAWPCGAVSTSWLVSQTLARTSECRPTRLLKGGGYRAQCFAGSHDIGAEGLKAGMYVPPAPPGDRVLPGYKELEAEARRERAGLWSSDFVMPGEWRRANGTYNPLEVRR